MKPQGICCAVFSLSAPNYPVAGAGHKVGGASWRGVSGGPWRIPLRTPLVRGTFGPVGDDEFGV